MSKMNPEVKARWVAALRSGEYEQGKEYLHKDDSFCCLGVLCDLHAKETGGAWEPSSFVGTNYYYGISGTLPPEVELWAGLTGPTSYNPSISVGRHTSSLANHNDNGRTFAEIADAIEAQL